MSKEELERFVEIEQRSKSNTRRIDKIENQTESIHELAISTKELAIEVKAMREELNKIDKRVLAIEDKPRQKYELIWGYVVSVVIGIIISFIFIKIGMK